MLKITPPPQLSAHSLFEKADTYSLRGICMVLIIVSHMQVHCVRAYGMQSYPFPIGYFFDYGGRWATGCFFLLSGYGLTCSLLKNRLTFGYIRKHLSALVYPSIYAFVVGALLGFEFRPRMEWFVETIFAVYLLTFAVFHFCKSSSLRIGVVTGTIVAWILLSEFVIHLPGYYTNTLLCYPLGMICYFHRPSEKKKWLILSVLCIMHVLFWVAVWAGISQFEYLYTITAALIGVYGCAVINIRNRVLDYMGRKSMLFYVLQIPLLIPLEKLLPSSLTYSVALFVALFVLTFVYYKVKEVLERCVFSK